MNECEYARQLLASRKFDETPIDNIFILARYWYHNLELSKEEVRLRLHSYLQAYCLDYDQRRGYWDKMVDSLTEKVSKYAPLSSVDGFWITGKELEKIKELNDRKLERLAFTILCATKLNITKNPGIQGWIQNDIKEIFDIARTPGTGTDRYTKIGTLYSAGLVDIRTRNTDLRIRSAIVDTDDSDHALYISDMRELGYQYMAHVYDGKRYTYCRKCGVIIKNTKHNTRKYCRNCAGRPPAGYQLKTCENCGCSYITSSKDSRSRLCPQCWAENKRIQDRLRKRQQREKLAMSQEQKEVQTF